MKEGNIHLEENMLTTKVSTSKGPDVFSPVLLLIRPGKPKIPPPKKKKMCLYTNPNPPPQRKEKKHTLDKSRSQNINLPIFCEVSV